MIQAIVKIKISKLNYNILYMFNTLLTVFHYKFNTNQVKEINST